MRDEGEGGAVLITVAIAVFVLANGTLMLFACGNHRTHHRRRAAGMRFADDVRAALNAGECADWIKPHHSGSASK